MSTLSCYVHIVDLWPTVNSFIRCPPLYPQPSLAYTHHITFSSRCIPNEYKNTVVNSVKVIVNFLYLCLLIFLMFCILVLCFVQAFFQSYCDLCEPSCYKPMLHDDHLDDLKHFRAKSKSWSGNSDRLGHSKGTQKAASKARFVQMRSCRRLP